ncbi:MAG: hypothetical protein Q9M94_01660 [Candidatus Gracilibacteria bacterium]|nr:hypothetical protein [Candidatus Gracilibacteria bacterium]
MKNLTTNFIKATKENLYEISLKSANAKNKEILIYELGELGDFIGTEKAEECGRGTIFGYIKKNF